MISRNTISLKDGSKLRCEVALRDDGGFYPSPYRITYYHDDTVVSLEGLKYLRDKIGLSE